MELFITYNLSICRSPIAGYARPTWRPYTTVVNYVMLYIKNKTKSFGVQTLYKTPSFVAMIKTNTYPDNSIKGNIPTEFRITPHFRTWRGLSERNGVETRSRHIMVHLSRKLFNIVYDMNKRKITILKLSD